MVGIMKKVDVAQTQEGWQKKGAKKGSTVYRSTKLILNSFCHPFILVQNSRVMCIVSTRAPSKLHANWLNLSKHER